MPGPAPPRGREGGGSPLIGTGTGTGTGADAAWRGRLRFGEARETAMAHRRGCRSSYYFFAREQLPELQRRGLPVTRVVDAIPYCSQAWAVRGRALSCPTPLRPPAGRGAASG